jgi:hypothetical protein
MTRKKLIKLALGVGLGGVVGYAYFYFIGCQSGTCPISSNPIISTAYGSVVGALLSFNR